MKNLVLLLTLIPLIHPAVQGQSFELMKKFETEPGFLLPYLEQENLHSIQHSDANGDGKADLVFFRPDETGHDAVMRIVLDPRDPSGNIIVLDLQGNQGLGFTDPDTPFLGFFDIYTDIPGDNAIRSFVFGGDGLFVYDPTAVNGAGRLYQAFRLDRGVYRLAGIMDLDDDGLVDFVAVNIADKTVSIWGYQP